MKILSQHPTSKRQKQASALLLTVLGGLALLTIAPTGNTQSSDGYRSNPEGGSEGGDNPVVGSLPCTVDPSLDLKFFQNASNATAGPIAPVLALVGSQLATQIETASGIPTGHVNRGGGSHTIMGLSKSGTMVLRRSHLANASATLSQWVPDSFRGGIVTATGTFGYSKSSINGNLAKLPVMNLAASPAVVGDMWFSIAPPPAPGGQSLPPVRVHVVLVGNLVSISYVP